MTVSSLENGLAVIHSNQLESLADVVEYWLSNHPLPPLAEDILLVNNNGMGQWIRQKLAHNQALGIVAGMDVLLPSRFIWRVYREVLGDKIPQEQPLAKAALVWRLYRLLPTLIVQPDFQPLASFLQDDYQQRKRYQLASQLADLFDQYQVYRSDWLDDWGKGQNTLVDGHGDRQPLPEAQTWQASLWRAVLEDLGDADSAVASRAAVHADFMARVDHSQPHLPARVIVFGLSSLPQQSLEVLVKIAQFCQVVLFIHNPCRYYWADIIEDKELLKAKGQRQCFRPKSPNELQAEEPTEQAHPLLAAWGKQGRDYIRLLDQFDDRQNYADWGWPNNQIDLFQDYVSSSAGSLLQQIQQSILDLEPLPKAPRILENADQSLVFHIAHSRQREIEILHDQLLARFNAAAQAGEPLQPRDVIVMVPDVNSYAPHVKAVFGQIAPDDPRYIPFSIADQNQRGHNPLLNAVEALLSLPDSRCTVSECLALLEVPALREKLALPESAVPTIQHWLQASGIRWGLNPEQRQASLNMPDGEQANTWSFGLERMLLGYAVGPGESFQGIEPYAGIGVLEAQWLGSLVLLQEKLDTLRVQLTASYRVTEWFALLQQLLDDFFVATQEQERKTLSLLTQSLNQWQRHSQNGGLGETESLPLSVVRDAWLSLIDEPSLQQRFLSGRVNFCTLMPMRAIPFRLVCILGMNDGDYPRSYQPQSFDLMLQRGQYRPGDRSRRQDDQYLFLEALLSARQQLYISWIGRSIRDNSERPPSVLVSQLRDFVSRGWQLAKQNANCLACITLEHPLQAFSQAYVKPDRDSRLFTYSREWFSEEDAALKVESPVVSAVSLPDIVSVEALARFMKAPVKAFCQTSLKFSFEQDSTVNADTEPFEFNALERYAYRHSLLQAFRQCPDRSLEDILIEQQQKMQRQGLLPLAGFGELSFTAISHDVVATWKRFLQLRSHWAIEQLSTPISQLVATPWGSVRITTDCQTVYQNEAGASALITLCPQAVMQDKGLRYDRLVAGWLDHLLLSISRPGLQSFVVAADAVLSLVPISTEAAQSILQQLMVAWYVGHQRPLPVDIKVAMLFLAGSHEAELRNAYEGSDSFSQWSKGVLDYDPYLKRFFADFASLNFGFSDDENSFDYWARRLYRPLFEQVSVAEGSADDKQ